MTVFWLQYKKRLRTIEAENPYSESQLRINGSYKKLGKSKNQPDNFISNFLSE